MALYRQIIIKEIEENFYVNLQNISNYLPMSEIDPRTLQLYSEEHLLMNDVVQGDAELLFLDTYLTDIFKCTKDCQ